jgi:hypothetical protein
MYLFFSTSSFADSSQRYVGIPSELMDQSMDQFLDQSRDSDFAGPVLSGTCKNLPYVKANRTSHGKLLQLRCYGPFSAPGNRDDETYTGGIST